MVVSFLRTLRWSIAAQVVSTFKRLVVVNVIVKGMRCEGKLDRSFFDEMGNGEPTAVEERKRALMTTLETSRMKSGRWWPYSIWSNR